MNYQLQLKALIHSKLITKTVESQPADSQMFSGNQRTIKKNRNYFLPINNLTRKSNKIAPPTAVKNDPIFIFNILLKTNPPNKEPTTAIAIFPTQPNPFPFITIPAIQPISAPITR